jgi:arginase family enzyme
MSALRARCPHCRTLTAVALDDGYECHSCGAVFAAGLVRVPRAWGAGGEAMAQAAATELPYPEALVVERASLEDQSTTLAHGLPTRPLVLGGCCCAHVGAIRGLAARHDRLAVVWLDAHGDLNTPETSPSGNLWGMPLRMAIDEGSVRTEDVALVGARDLDPPEQEYVAEHGIDDDLARALRDTDAAYVALDVDVLEPGSVSCFMPAPGGPEVADVERLLLEIASRRRVAGMGLTGLAPGADPAVLARFAAMAGL